MLKKVVDKLYEQRGLESGLGYPQRQDLERMLVYRKADEGPVLAELKRLWRTDVEAMRQAQRYCVEWRVVQWASNLNARKKPTMNWLGQCAVGEQMPSI